MESALNLWTDWSPIRGLSSVDFHTVQWSFEKNLGRIFRIRYATLFPTNSIFSHIHLKMFSDSLPLVTQLGDLSHSYWNNCTIRTTETYNAVMFWVLTCSETSLEAPWVSPGQPAGKMEEFATHIEDISRSPWHIIQQINCYRNGAEKNITIYWFSCRPLRTCKWTKASTPELSLSAGAKY